MTVRVRLREEEEFESRRGARRSTQRRGLRWAEYFFLFVGLIALDYYIWVSLDATLSQAYESWSFDQELKGRPISVPGFIEDEVGAALAWIRSQPKARDETKSPEVAERPSTAAP